MPAKWNFTTVLAAVVFGTIALPVHAQDPNESWFYVGASAGEVETTQDQHYYEPFRSYPFSDEVTVDLVESSGVDLESSERTERYHVGYRANRYLAFEAGYADLGASQQVTFCPGNLAVPEPVFCVPELYGRSESRTKRADFTVSVILPLGSRIELFGKVGLARTKHTTYASHVDVEYATGRIYGAGARFFVTPAWALRLDFDRSEVPGSLVNHHPATKQIDSLWLGVEYGFR